MPLPISKSQLDRLGQRLATADTIADADHELLQDVLNAYDETLTVVEARLQDLGFTVTVRVKTMGTLIDKLRREQGMKLSQVQDAAGARLVVPGARRHQDEAIARVVRAFTGPGKPPRVRDRRQQPSSGYRAVHVIVFADGLPVEIQVRTQMQNRWAQVYERLADRWGRAMRYGGQPEEPDMVTSVGRSVLTRRRVVEVMHEVSDGIDELERDQLILGGPDTTMSPAALAASMARQAALHDVIASILDMIAREAD